MQVWFVGCLVPIDPGRRMGRKRWCWPLRPSCPSSSTSSRPYQYFGCQRCKERPAGTTECRGKIRNSIWC